VGTPLRRLRAISIAEGVSYLVLLGIAMPLKYLAGQPEAVSVFGSLHGLLTILFVLAVAHVWAERRWPVRRVILALIASVIPFGAFALDARLRREERADLERASAPSAG
jgi:integral membrane protein